MSLSLYLVLSALYFVLSALIRLYMCNFDETTKYMALSTKY